MYTLASYEFIWLDEHPIVSYDNGKEVRIYTDCDGYVSYFLTGGERNVYLMQLFSKNPIHQSYGKNVWQWDGNKENPTINPSFRWIDGVLHLFVKNGKLDILPDTTVDYSHYKRIA